LTEETVKERQARVQKAGGDWEEYVRLFLTEKLRNKGIKVLRGDKIAPNSVLWRKLSIPIKVSTLQESVWGDIDLVAVKGKIPVAIISCKLSLHGRFTETLFYSILFRMMTRIKVVLATPDAGRGQRGRWQSEWGEPEKPTKDRLLAESYLDGVYVDNLKQFCRYIKTGQTTVFGGIVRPLSELPEDLVKWAEEASKFIYVRKT